jgi:UDPglucose--hexose-1-phosphate uridylyltransferase
MNGEKNPDYTQTFTFENDFAAVLPAPAPEAPTPVHPLMISEPVHGACDVLLFHPRHDLTIARMTIKDIEFIIDDWIRIYHKRGSQTGIEYVQIFEVSIEPFICLVFANPNPLRIE